MRPLEEVEKRAYRSQMSPWLWDLFLSGVVVMLGLFVGYNRAPEGVTGLVIFGVAMLCWVLLMKWAQVRVVRPRVGEAVFGARRRQRVRRQVWVLAGSVMLGVLVFLWAPWLLGAAESFGGGVWLLGIFGVQAVLIFSLMAWFQDYPQGYAWGWILALAMPSVEWSLYAWGWRFPVFPLCAGLVMSMHGLCGLRLFLREFPQMEADLDLEARRAGKGSGNE